MIIGFCTKNSDSFDKAFLKELIVGEVRMDSLSEFQSFIVEGGYEASI
jgi:hypothetical protein